MQTSMREANDRGFECLLVEDATESYFPEFKAATLAMVAAQGGIVGWVDAAGRLKEAVRDAPPHTSILSSPATRRPGRGPERRGRRGRASRIGQASEARVLHPVSWPFARRLRRCGRGRSGSCMVTTCSDRPDLEA